MLDGEAVSDPMSLMGRRRAAWQNLWCRQPFAAAFWINGLVTPVLVLRSRSKALPQAPASLVFQSLPGLLRPPACPIPKSRTSLLTYSSKQMCTRARVPWTVAATWESEPATSDVSEDTTCSV